MAGDAAGLVDLTRGVGMDSAALSGRLVAKAIIKAEEENSNALRIYTNLMKKVVKKTQKNQGKGIHLLANNKELRKYLRKNVFKMGMGLLFQSFLNKFRNPERLTLIPP